MANYSITFGRQSKDMTSTFTVDALDEADARLEAGRLRSFYAITEPLADVRLIGAAPVERGPSRVIDARQRFVRARQYASIGR